MVGLNAVVGVLLGVMHDVEQDLVDHPQQRSSEVGGDLRRPAVIAEDCVEEPAYRCGVAFLGDVDVDDLAVLVNGSIHETPDAGDLHICLVDKPSVSDVTAARTCRVDEQGCEALDPSVDRDVIDLDTALWS